MKVYEHISHLFTMQPMHEKHGHEKRLKNAQSLEDCGYISDGAVCVNDHGVVSWVGTTSQLPQGVLQEKNISHKDCRGETWLPGLVDCHTHLVFSGQRSVEMMRKRSGESYLQIAKEGGGILSTVAATQDCDEDRLFELACDRVLTARHFGVHHIEIKSGYGLSVQQEIKILNVIARLKQHFLGRIGITSTFMGAHAIPREKTADEYVQEICAQMLPFIVERQLAEFCDVFIEEGFFTLKQGEKILKHAQRLGLKLKAHVDECTSLGGVELACELGATSIEHGIKLTPDGIRALSRSNTTLVLLPMTSFILQEGFAPARAVLDQNIRVALATDFNPGSSPSQNLVLAALMGMIQYGLTPFEVLSAVTYNAAVACDQQKQVGRITQGLRAQFLRLAYSDWQELFYWVGQPLPIVPEEMT